MDFADYKDEPCILYPVSCNLYLVSCILHLILPPHQTPFIKFPLWRNQGIYLFCTIPWAQFSIPGVFENVNVLRRHKSLGQHKYFSAYTIFRYGYYDNRMAGKTALNKYIAWLNIAGQWVKLPA